MDSLVLTVSLTNNYVMRKLRLQKAGLYSRLERNAHFGTKTKPTPAKKALVRATDFTDLYFLFSVLICVHLWLNSSYLLYSTFFFLLLAR